MIHQIENLSYNDESGIILKDNVELKLTKIQKKLLNYFIAHPRVVISKEKLMEDVWGRIVTENTINKFISALRSYVEQNPATPKLIITHFGHGISFECDVFEKPNDKYGISATSKNKKLLYTGLLFLLLVVIAVWMHGSGLFKQDKLVENLQQNKQLLMLPMDFDGGDISIVQQQGINELLKSTFNNAESEGQLVFDQSHAASNMTNRQIIEKYWRLNHELVILQSKVLKNGEVYEAVLELSNGLSTLNVTTLRSNNLDELLSDQIAFIADYHDGLSTQLMHDNTDHSLNQVFIEALGHKKIGELDKAKDLLRQILDSREDFYQARFELAKILSQEKKYDQSLSHLNTLKATSAYGFIGTELELELANINYTKHEYDLLISNLKRYQSDHLGISEIKKSKIKLQIAKACFAMGDIQNAMKFYKQAIINIEDKFNPNIYTQSYYGQAMVMINNSNDDEVYALFEQALNYAKAAGNLHYQILSLDEMSKMLLVGNEWDKGIALKKQALELMELGNDKSEVAKGLGTLAAFLIQSGHFTDAKEINDRLGKIAKDLNRDDLLLHFLHYDIVLALNAFEFEQARAQIDRHLSLAQQIKNYAMQLDNAFLEFELRLANKDTLKFKDEWDSRTAMIKELGFDRYQVYMDLYLARYYKQVANNEAAIQVINRISEKARVNNDIKILVDAQNQLAEIYLEIDAQKALAILNAIEKYSPDANPHLELKALALNKLGKYIEALNLLNQAKLVFHEAWKSENQVLLESLQDKVN
jgi:DNA-binding winged helix-turn-helix (wHTH) protein